jgi:Bacterial pre-peptidase C-terminal domain
VYDDNFNPVRNLLFPLALLTILLIHPHPSWAVGDCQSALNGTSGFTSLNNGSPSNTTKRVDEWDSEVVKLRTSKPGVLTIAGTGYSSLNSLYADAASGPHPLVDSAQLGTSQQTLQAVIAAGDHCITVAPPPGASGDFEVEATFIDVCHLGSVDDHGSSFLCATSLTLGVSDEGEIDNLVSGNDVDMFTFELSSPDEVAIVSDGTTDVEASLYDEEGDLKDSDDNSGGSPNFEIIQSLPAGRYYVRVQGVASAEGEYEIEVAPTP